MPGRAKPGTKGRAEPRRPAEPLLCDQLMDEIEKLWARHSVSRNHFKQAGVQILLGLEALLDELLEPDAGGSQAGRKKVTRIRVED